MNIIIKYTLMLLLFVNISYSQINWQNSRINSTDPVVSLKFVNPNTGWILTNTQILKTYDKGVSFTSQKTFQSGYGRSDIEFIDANTGFLYVMDDLYKTTNGGVNWYSLNHPFPNANYTKTIKFANANTGYTSHTEYDKLNIYKTVNGGNSWTKITNDWFLGIYAIISDICYGYDTYGNVDPNKVWFCGYTTSSTNLNSLLIKTENGFSTYYAYSNLSSIPFSHIAVVPGTDFVNGLRILGSDGIYTIQNTTPVLQFYMSSYFNYFQFGLSFSNANLGFAAMSDGKVWKSTDQGLSWVQEFDINLQQPSTGYGSRLNSFNEIAYFGFLSTYQSTNYGAVYVRPLYTNIQTIYNGNNPDGAGTMTIDGNPISTPFHDYWRGGNTSFIAPLNLNSGNEVFSNWFNKQLNPSLNFYFDNSGNTFSANYKSKLKADNPVAISNASQTKSTRDTLGYIHIVQESDEGIFYTRSTNNGSNFDINSYSTEEVVNSGYVWNLQFPNDASGFNNYSPSLCETRDLMSGKALATDYPYNSIVTCWEHNTSVGQTDIRVAIRITNTVGGDPEWLKYNSSGGTNYDGIIKSFSSNSSFRAKPVIFASCPTSYLNDPYNYLFLVSHLEPSTNGNKLVVTAKYQNKGIYPPNGNTNDFIIADDNVSEFAVTAKPTYYNNINNGYYLYFVYKQGEDIKYQKELICLGYIGDETVIGRSSTLETNTISTGDGWYERNSADISLRNELPVISYVGRYDAARIVHYENGGDGSYTSHYYPVRVIYKTTSSGNDWASYVYNSDGISTQENTNVEGSRNSNAFLLNFSKNYSLFKQFVKIIGSGNYYCCPATFSGTDSKFIDGSYGQFQPSSNPKLLTLTASNLLYTVENRNQSISNQPCNDPGTDGFNNLYGTVDKTNITYKYNLGPIIVKNTIQGISDDQPPETIENAAEFNENMVSSRFLLSNNDTLIIGGYGLYLPNPVGTFVPMKYRVDLIKSSNNQLQRTLFIDTVQVNDSLETEFLRGYIISGIANGSDSFYVQLRVNTLDLNNATYTISGVYQDQDPNYIEDNISGYKTRVFFENESLQNNIINNIPKSFELSQNYPNPFNPTTTIKYALPKNEFVTIKVYDITGREIMRLVNENKQAGYHSVNFNGGNMASGVYFYRIQAGDFMSVKRMLMIK